MTSGDTMIPQHLSVDLLTRALDDELSTAERFQVERHLAFCERCRSEYHALNHVSLEIESVVESAAARWSTSAQAALRRRFLETALEAEAKPALPAPGRVMRRFGWGMAIAATLAFAVLLAPKPEVSSPLSQPANSIEVDGETFTSLPYSNPDLPLNAEHIVQMQVPVSSLADAGIVLEPVVSGLEDNSVLADVLLGGDGQPRAVHVLGIEE